MTPYDYMFITFNSGTIGISSSYDGNQIMLQGGVMGSPGYSFSALGSSYGIGPDLVTEGSIIDSSLTFYGNGSGTGQSGTFTGNIYEPIVKISGSDTYYGYIQMAGNGSENWELTSISWEATPNKAVTVVNTAVPEPSTYALFGMGALALFARRRKVA